MVSSEVTISSFSVQQRPIYRLLLLLIPQLPLKKPNKKKTPNPIEKGEKI